MKALRTHASWRAHAHRSTATIVIAALALAACGGDDDAGDDDPADTADTTEAADTADAAETDTGDAPDLRTSLNIGAIPDQDPEVLGRLYGLVADRLESELPGIDVEYVPVTDYQGAISGFVVGDLDLVWYGGLTGVQARLEVDGARALVQRDIDAEFTSVFIANAEAGIEPFEEVAGLSALADHSFTFGSESSTSGRLMPQSFLAEAGLDIDESFTGEVGFSGSHDATIELVAAGTYETGALNSQVWDSRVAEGAVDTSQVIEVFRTPTYYDYHWVAQPDLDDDFGAGFTDAIVDVLTSLDPSDPDDLAILDLFGATAFIPTENSNYDAIEAVARDIGAIR
jgi:phosphonate transport system substrate-binding protein